jgi:hypothetical protein
VARRGHRWATFKTDDLLRVRICDLDVQLEGTWVDALIDKVQSELEDRDLRAKPHFWLADEWFSPDGVPGVGVPFYLAHPRLTRLERQQMFDAEGSAPSSCIKILRHELGHAVQTAWALHRRRGFQRVFGSVSKPYPEWYRPNPRSRRYVQHLDGWYAQVHPAEDFAETFAVWLRPRSGWRVKYRDWPAYQKLEYVDEVMSEISGTRPRVRSRARPYSLPRLRYTLGTHYDRKREHYSPGYSEAYDRDLLRLFSDDPRHRRNESAAMFLRRNRRELRSQVARWTGQIPFTVDQVMREMIGRCRELGLRRVGNERQVKVDFAIMLTTHTLQAIYTGGGWHAV